MNAINGLAEDKTPGPDGFIMVVYLRLWVVMKSDIIKMIRDFHANYFLDWRLNTMFIALVPTKEVEITIQDFSPIFLLSRVHKMAREALASRVKAVMESLVSDLQCGGLQNRGNQEGILIVNKLIGTRLKENKAGLTYKIDFSKAIDSISWEFIDKLLAK